MVLEQSSPRKTNAFVSLPATQTIIIMLRFKPLLGPKKGIFHHYSYCKVNTLGCVIHIIIIRNQVHVHLPSLFKWSNREIQTFKQARLADFIFTLSFYPMCYNLTEVDSNDTMNIPTQPPESAMFNIIIDVYVRFLHFLV